MIDKETKRILIFEYENVLLGKVPIFDSFHFRDKSPEIQEEYALFLIQHLIETYLRWTPAMARDHLDESILKLWKLHTIARRIPFPDGLIRQYDNWWYAHRIYPHIIVSKKQDIYQTVYKRVIDPSMPGHRAKFPKDFFSGEEGITRACACLKYAIEHSKTFHSVGEMYEFFGTRACLGFIRNAKLMVACKSLFDAPIEFLDTFLPPSQQDEFLLRYYKLFQLIDENEREKTEKRGKPAKTDHKSVRENYFNKKGAS